MALHIDPAAVPDPERDERQKGTPGRIELRPATREAVLGRRALACPRCDFPLAVSRPVPLRSSLVCAFCDEVAPATSYLQDEGWPGFELIARLKS